MYRPSIGELVEIKNGLGIAKIAELDSKQAILEYFDSPANYKAHQETAALEELAPVELHQETSVYFYDFDNEVWHWGRIVGPNPIGYRVQLPNGDLKDIEPVDLYVRWYKPISGAVDLLANRITYTPFFQDARINFQLEMLKQRKSCAGITAALASSIELEPHQLAVVRRVLSDPCQRYLLADEVGLGKTIEAGLILREHVQEKPTSHFIVIIVPPVLIRQWLKELAQRFHVGELLEESIHVVRTDKCELLKELERQPDMIIVDEAHQVGAWAWDSQRGEDYQCIADLAKKSEKLLLLSATPIVGNELNFLTMLHMLDSANYDLSADGIDAFRNKVKLREDIGGIFHAFNVENDNLSLDDILTRLLGLFPEDQFLVETAKQIKPHLDLFAPERCAERDVLVTNLRQYIGNRYRIHHRMLRNRRSNAAINVLLPGLGGLTVEYYCCEWSVNNMFSAWRDCALLTEYASTRLEEVYRIFLNAQLATPGLLGLLASIRIGETPLPIKGLPLGELQQEHLLSPLFDGEVEILHELTKCAQQEQIEKDNLLAEILKEQLNASNIENCYFLRLALGS